MLFKTKTDHTISKEIYKTYMSHIFPNGLPIGSFIDKGRCGIGGTTIELKDKSRSTLIIVPNVSILLGKLNANNVEERPDYIIYGVKTQTMVNEYMKDARQGLKIMSTPESIGKVIKGAIRADRLDELYRTWFILLDESHTFITELYRKNILLPFKYFWLFDKRSIISATPYQFSDPIFSELDFHKVIFTEPLGLVTLVNAKSVNGTLNEILKNIKPEHGNLHIFYNSVTAIKEAILRSEITDCNIFCANDKDQNNILKLGELEKFFLAEPTTGCYKKVNFYTCKYFEGWDLVDANATLILVTDIYKPHTKVGVASKGKQALGRLRNAPYKLIHITNHDYKDTMTTLEEYRASYTKDAHKLIMDNNHHVMESKIKNIRYDKLVESFADVDEKTKIATFNSLKLDQLINESASNEIYRNIKFIEEDWKKSYFEVDVKYSNIKLESKTKTSRKSLKDKLKEDIEALYTYRESDNNNLFYIGETVEDEIKKRNPLAYKASKFLLKKKLQELNYNVKKVEAELILISTERIEIKLTAFLKKIFRKDRFYFNSFILSKLQDLYNQLDIRDTRTGEIKKALPSQLAENERFIIKKGRRKNPAGKLENGYFILGIRLSLKVSR